MTSKIIYDSFATVVFLIKYFSKIFLGYMLTTSSHRLCRRQVYDEVKPVHYYTPSGRITARMMDELRKIRSTEQGSHWNALNKYRSEVGEARSVQSLNRFRGKFQRQIIDGLSKELQIVKIRNKYMCNKHRVDAMDFKLWFFVDRSYYET